MHELHLVAGLGAYPLDLVDRGLAPSGGYSVAVITSPMHGTLSGEDYSPTADFWTLGVDHLTLDIVPLVGATTRHTFVLAPAPEPSPSINYYEDFDLSTEISAWTSTGAPTTVNPGIEGTSLRASMGTTPAISHLSRTLNESEGVHAVGAAGTTIPDPPDNTQTDVAIPGWVNIAVAGLDESNPALFLQLRLDSGVYSMRASTQFDGSLACNGCATPWRNVPAGQPIDFTLWAGPMVISGDAGRAHQIRLELDLPGTADDTVDWLEGGVDMNHTSYGLHQSSGLQNFGILYDRLTQWTEDRTFAPQTLVFDDFEDGGANSWTYDGPALVNAASALVGSYGASIDVDALRAGAPRDALLVDLAPSVGDAITEIAAQMTLDLTSLDLENGESVRVLVGSENDNIEQELHVSIIVHRHNSNYRIWARMRDDNAAQHKSPTYVLNTLTPRVSLHWYAAPATEGGGAVSLWVDGVSTGSSPNEPNGTRGFEGFAFGAFKPTLNTVGTNPYMEILIDDVVVLAR